jgi:hypothetical protein
MKYENSRFLNGRLFIVYVDTAHVYNLLSTVNMLFYKRLYFRYLVVAPNGEYFLSSGFPNSLPPQIILQQQHLTTTAK